tara:strand:+ start:432 stop:560 length:129 start_codon:yes stop_codon:yes gene_type:complete
MVSEANKPCAKENRGSGYAARAWYARVICHGEPTTIEWHNAG